MNPNRRAEKARVIGELNRGYNKGGRIGLKKGKAVTKADIAKRDLWRKRELKKRSRSKMHPLHPFKIHADTKAIDWTSRRKDVYGRTRDELKKSKDPDVKGVAEGFQKMDYKDKLKTGGRVGLKKGSNGKWIQSATASIKRRGTEGVCTGKKFGGPTCPPGSKRYNLAKTFKKMGKARKA